MHGARGRERPELRLGRTAPCGIAGRHRTPCHSPVKLGPTGIGEAIRRPWGQSPWLQAFRFGIRHERFLFCPASMGDSWWDQGAGGRPLRWVDWSR